MTPLPIRIPPQLPEAVGYAGDARLLSLCWTTSDKPWYDDGVSSGTGDSWAYLAFVRHAAVAPHLAAYGLGGCELEARHRLLLDLRAGTVSVGTSAEVRDAVRRQWPAQDEVRLTPEQLDAVVDHVRRVMESRPLPTAGQLMASLRRHSTLVAEMIRWLDAQAAEGKQ